MSVQEELLNYELNARIVPVSKQISIIMRPLGAHAAFENGARYTIYICPMEQSNLPDGREKDYPSVTVHVQDGLLRFAYVFEQEQEYILRIYKQGQEKIVTTQRIYALLPDLFARRPYRGDMHCHTYYSDGKEAPATMAAHYRQAGFDFVSITDHGQYFPSIEAIEAYRELPVDLLLMPGEEIHPPQNHIHMLGVGGNASVNEYMRNHEAEYRKEVTTLMDSLSIPRGVNAYEAASCAWCFAKIKELGGLSVFCHPHWVQGQVYNVPQNILDFLFDTQLFDAFELLGGQEAKPNNLQIAYFYEQCARGKHFPVIGVGDSHGSVEISSYFNWNKTVVFSPVLVQEEILSSIKDNWSVAVETQPGEQARVFGPYRLVKYTHFLLETLFPLHDALCFEEGRAMQDAVYGSAWGKRMLSATQGRTKEFVESCYAR